VASPLPGQPFTDSRANAARRKAWFGLLGRRSAPHAAGRASQHRTRMDEDRGDLEEYCEDLRRE